MFYSKKLFAFDLDDTLTPAKSKMDTEMAGLIAALTRAGKFVAVISGGLFSQFEKQFLGELKEAKTDFKNLLLLPTCGAAFYRYRSGRGWVRITAKNLTGEHKGKIMRAFLRTFKETGYAHPEKVYGNVFEDRGAQITFSALGQEAPLELKRAWDPRGEKRHKLRVALMSMLPEFDVVLGGTTSIDILPNGVNKAYGIKKIEEHVGISKRDMIFFGDKLSPGGNDYSVKLYGVECVEVKNPENTKKILRTLLA